MATRFIGSAIDFHETIQQELCCSIHQGLLSQPIALPCLHRFCRDCLKGWVQATPQLNSHIRCPNCNAQHVFPVDWETRWFDRIVDAVTNATRSSETEINKKIANFVQESFSQFGQTNERLKINAISPIHNLRLKERFEQCKRALRSSEVVTLLHGTDRASALSISNEGFRIPTSFERCYGSAEGELKFGKGIYFAHAKKATEYGQNILVLADCVLGSVWKKTSSELMLTPENVHASGYHAIHIHNTQEGLVNQEWAIYRVDQCLPLCIIEYEITDVHAILEAPLIEKVKKMDFFRPDHSILQKALFGTDNQCKAVLHFAADACLQASSQASLIMYSLLSRAQPEQLAGLFTHPNETVRILLLRALWHAGRRDRTLQFYFHTRLNFDSLLNSLQSSYTDVSWRACGVLANMAACVIDIRRLLITTETLQKLLNLLQRSINSQDKTGILTVTNLLANIACSEYQLMKQINALHELIDASLLDHPDQAIQEAGNRFFCNMIGNGSVTNDWIQAGYQETAMAPDLDDTSTILA